MSGARIFTYRYRRYSKTHLVGTLLRIPFLLRRRRLRLALATLFIQRLLHALLQQLVLCRRFVLLRPLVLRWLVLLWWLAVALRCVGLIVAAAAATAAATAEFQRVKQLLLLLLPHARPPFANAL